MLIVIIIARVSIIKRIHGRAAESLQFTPLSSI